MKKRILSIALAVLGIAFVTLLIMQFGPHKAEAILRNLVDTKVRAIQSNQIAVSETLLVLDEQTFSLRELEQISDKAENIFNNLVEIEDILVQYAPAKRNESNSYNLIAIYQNFYRFLSYTLPTTQGDKVHDDTILLAPEDRSKLALIGNVCKITSEISEDFRAVEFSDLKALLENQEACIKQQFEAISDYLKQEYAFEMLSTRAYSESLLESLFD